MTAEAGVPAPLMQAMPERDCCSAVSCSSEVRETPGPFSCSVVCSTMTTGEALGEVPGGSTLGERVAISASATLEKETVPVDVGPGVPLAVSLLLAEEEEVTVDEGVEPNVSEAVGDWLGVRLRLRVTVPEAEAPRVRLALAVLVREAPNEGEADASSERETVRLPVTDAVTKLVLVGVAGLEGLTVRVGVNEGVLLSEAAAPGDRLSVALGVPEAPLEPLAVALIELDAPVVMLAVAVPVLE